MEPIEEYRKLIEVQSMMIQALKDELFDRVILVWDEDWFVDMDEEIGRLKSIIEKTKS